MKAFKFLAENKINIEDDPLYHLNVYENMALGLISYCCRMNLVPVSYQHQFEENGLSRHLVITDLISHDYFECRHVRIKYDLYDINGLEHHTFHLAEDVFIEVMRRHETI
jgi:hypothetical protein